MKMNNYIKTLLAALVMFEHSNNGYSTSNDNYQPLQKTQAITKNEAKQIEKDLHNAWMADKLAKDLEYARKNPVPNESVNITMFHNTLNEYIKLIEDKLDSFRFVRSNNDNEFIKFLKGFNKDLQIGSDNIFAFVRTCGKYIVKLENEQFNNKNKNQLKQQLIKTIENLMDEIQYKYIQLYQKTF